MNIIIRLYGAGSSETMPVARLVPEGAPRLDEVRRCVQGLRDLQQRIRRRSKVEAILCRQSG
jgi:hypothetical protein